MKQGYSYAIIKANNSNFAKESTLLDNKYKPKAKYVLIEKIVHKDCSENISRILYSNNLESLHSIASKYVSWYNYPISLHKDIQQNILNLA